MADPGLDHHPGAPLRRRRPQKWDGSGGQDEQALGRSRGGFGTKIHGAVSGLGLPAKLILTPGQAADMTHAKALIEGLPIEVVIADKGYDSRAVVEAIEARGAEAVIPSLKNRAEQRVYDRERSKDRNPAERFWFKAKQYRRVATRYDKTARNFLAFVHVASIMILLQ
jgi:transposase